ncbi:hypothetical protein G9A89_012270 [Geosiphon pyriformis]|nr:hypothetical protein G9A89_012270 [Geosiphon pyriformis]
MGDYLYLSQQLKEHFEAHNKNNLNFIELNPLPSYLICFPIENNPADNSKTFETETPLKTKEESYQTVSVFDLFSSESKHSTQTVTLEPMAQDSLQQNILIALQGIQTALRQRNNTPLLLFRAATANQYDNEYKFQIVGGYFQGSPTTWFSQETNANA